MQGIDLSPLIENDNQYEKVVAGVSESYKCDWNDEVHDSYKRYVDQLQNSSKELRMIRTKAETLEKETEQLKIDDFIRKSKELSGEINSI